MEKLKKICNRIFIEGLSAGDGSVILNLLIQQLPHILDSNGLCKIKDTFHAKKPIVVILARTSCEFLTTTAMSDPACRQ